MRNLIIFIVAVTLMFFSFTLIPKNTDELMFSQNSWNLNKSFESQFTLIEDGHMKFKVASTLLDEDDSIRLTHLDSGRIYLDYSGRSINDLVIKDLPKGRYQWDIKKSQGSMNFRIKITQ